MRSYKSEVLEQLKRMVDFDEIMVNLSLSKYELLSIIYMFMFKSDYLFLDKDYLKDLYVNNASFIDLESSKVIFISDTHLASKYENLDYLEKVKNFIVENDIDMLFHGGDIGDGMVRYSSKYGNWQLQIDHILDVYLDFCSLKQYILGGNHDSKYLKKGADILKILEGEDEKIVGLGYYQAYFRVYEKIISFEHNFKRRGKLLNSDFVILGHSHEFCFLDKKVKLPTLSDSITSVNSVNAIPGFMVLETSLEDNMVCLSFDDYAVDDDEVKVYQKKKYILE